MSNPPAPRRVALFVTCLVDFHRPSVGFRGDQAVGTGGVPWSRCHWRRPAAAKPAYNSGDRATGARAGGPGLLDAFGGFDYVVVPSGSLRPACCGCICRACSKTIRTSGCGRMRWREKCLGTGELPHRRVRGDGGAGRVRGESCLSRCMCRACGSWGCASRPRALLQSMPGVSVAELPDRDVCCGFGGTFCVKYPEISTRMVTAKVAQIRETGAATLAAGRSGVPVESGGAAAARRQRHRGGGMWRSCWRVSWRRASGNREQDEREALTDGR